MRRVVTVLFLLLVPALGFGLCRKEVKVRLQSAQDCEREARTRIDSAQQTSNRDESLQLLGEAEIWTHRAIGKHDEIIDGKRKHRHHQRWHERKRDFALDEKQRLHGTFSEIYTFRAVQCALKRAEPVYAEGARLAEQAYALYDQSLQDPDSFKLNVRILQVAGHLYDAAAEKAAEAVDILAPVSGVDCDPWHQSKLSWELSGRACRDSILATELDFVRKRLAHDVDEGKTLEQQGYLREALAIYQAALRVEERLGETRLSQEIEELKARIHQVRAPPPSVEMGEEQRREHFFARALNCVQIAEQQGKAIPIDGQSYTVGNTFGLFRNQPSRFYIPRDEAEPHLNVRVYNEGEVVHAERIYLPQMHTLSWERYVLEEGFLHMPESALEEYGIELRIMYAPDPENPFSLLITIKLAHKDYAVELAFDDELLCRYGPMEPPPWQLQMLCKPFLPAIDLPIVFRERKIALDNPIEADDVAVRYPLLDQLVEELKSDPVALAQFVQNEIAFVDPFAHRMYGIFRPPSVMRNPGMTFLERRGSPWEQCALLVYLLRQAGYTAHYAFGPIYEVAKEHLEKLLFKHFDGPPLVSYPWVIVRSGETWIELFPWLKEMHIDEGYDLYSLMPPDFSSAYRWIQRYLHNDPRILKHIGADGDDSAGVLFLRTVEEELHKQGLSLADVGTRRTIIHKQYTSWECFPKPELAPGFMVYAESWAADAKATLTFSSGDRFVRIPFSLSDLNAESAFLRFEGEGLRIDFPGQKEEVLELRADEHAVHCRLVVEIPFFGEEDHEICESLTLERGETAALCFSFGSPHPGLSAQYHKAFAQAQGDNKRIHALLAHVGASYFERCLRAAHALCDAHKIVPTNYLYWGCAKFIRMEDSCQPQVDMLSCRAAMPTMGWRPDYITAQLQCQALELVDGSSNEHQILRDIFRDPDPVSTVKVLQQAHKECLSLTPARAEIADSMPEAAHVLYFENQPTLRSLLNQADGEWEVVKSVFDKGDPLHPYAYAYMTPGHIKSSGGHHNERGTLIVSPNMRAALISCDNRLRNGGYGSPIWDREHPPLPVPEWYVESDGHLHCTPKPLPSTQITAPSLPTPPPLRTDVRQAFKSTWKYVGDPVDVTTGAYIIDTIDLLLPGPVPLHIRRNYSSQNPIDNPLGHGWRFSLNPSLVKQEGLLYAAEEDGTLIAYRHNSSTNRWEVHPDDNPELWNANARNPFHAYFENDILYSPDGSTRHFENGLLKTWTNAHGQTLTFTYEGGQLTRIESSFGAYIGFHYNGEGRISEIFAQDGRRIAYSYNAHGDLVEVTLPNKATIAYTYDDTHRITRETKPHGQILENIYDEEGRVKQQRASYGPQQMSTTQFLYRENGTDVIDPLGFCTKYAIYEKQITKITDPEGNCILNSWYIDDTTWYDAEAECIRSSEQLGAAPRSLKMAQDKRGMRTEYTYDAHGNPATVIISGQDLTGDGGTQFSKRLTYNERNLCIAEQSCNRTTHITYDETYPYLPKRIETLTNNALISCDEYTYNAQGLLQCEEHSGAITHWEYDSRGFPILRTQCTGTSDPDITIGFIYNYQGQCIEEHTPDARITSTYDIMGNCTQTQTHAHSGDLIALVYTGYNQNNQPIWKRGANPNDITHFDYDSTGLLKAKRQTVDDAQTPTYEIYAYDARGSLIEEVDPSGHCTSCSYDALARLQCVSQDGKSTTLTYEPGGSLAFRTSPKGATTRYYYSTNGLCIREELPGGTTNHTVYDFFGRPIRETKDGITWHTHYDDAQRTILRIHPASGSQEYSTYDMRGNLVRHTDAAGRTWEKCYDCLNRITSEIDPSGETTTWSYRDDTIIITLPSNERIIKRYAKDELVEEEAYTADNQCISHTTYRRDIVRNVLAIQYGEEMTKVVTNHRGQPIIVEQGGGLTTFEYDACGNCIATSDSEGRKTAHAFDALHRKTRTQFPDSTCTHYVYDEDSHLTEYHLPNNTTWCATYDPMGRIATHELRSMSGMSSQRWAYHYTQGRLVEMQDPLNRTHMYQYDALGRCIHEQVNGWHRAYTYDPSGVLTSAEQSSHSGEVSLVERSFDASGRIATEDISFNGTLLQHTEQSWTPTTRVLRIGEHARHHTYQNGKLIYTGASNIALGYQYTPSDRVRQKSSPHSQTTIERTLAGLPHVLHTQTNQSRISETLEWDKTQRLSRYTANDQTQTFTYTDRGFLKTAGPLQYTHNVMGMCTASPQSQVTEHGIDAFGQVIQEIDELGMHNYAYDASGQLTMRDQETLTWDPWGCLIAVASPHYQWSASYDALGRRLQTTAITNQGPSVTTSLYDPEEEFREIGTCIAGKTFWKYYGPEGTCDALSDDAGNNISLVHNALHQLACVLSSQGDVYSTSLPTPYGPTGAPAPMQPDLLPIAQSLAWHSTAQDPTGLIWLGARYYDPRAGRFLSPDPVGYPACLDLYGYANGDPVNFHDPDGRFASRAYERTAPTVIAAWNNPRFQGALQTVGGFAEVAVSVPMTVIPSPLTPLGVALYMHGSDHFAAGSYTAITGRHRETLTHQLLQTTGMSGGAAALVDGSIGVAGITAGAGAIAKLGRELSLLKSAAELGHGAKVPKVLQLERRISQWLGEGTKLIKNSAGDSIFLSKDGLRCVRFDLNRPYPHNNVHAHLEIKIDGKWIKSGPIYPKDVPHN